MLILPPIDRVVYVTPKGKGICYFCARFFTVIIVPKVAALFRILLLERPYMSL